ncbi:hypothetical protein [Algoriphagus sp.]|uniref:hypothetical protein n=1 Tax=Algoriphagus sp. TaxID=1872435 RepID=UPI0025EEFF55|nr:hypothetical protein [Algoriphagus sp.]
MIQLYPGLNNKILEIAEGDEDFRIELIQAIHNGLIELKAVYSKGHEEKDEVVIQQIRHKLKPTLVMFDFEDLVSEIQKGKVILESEGFTENYSTHVLELNRLLEGAICEVNLLLK